MRSCRLVASACRMSEAEMTRVSTGLLSNCLGVRVPVTTTCPRFTTLRTESISSCADTKNGKRESNKTPKVTVPKLIFLEVRIFIIDGQPAFLTFTIEIVLQLHSS